MNLKIKKLVLLLAITSSSTVSYALDIGGMLDLGNDSAKTAATGSAGGGNAQNANAQLEHCDNPLGTVAIVEDQRSDWYYRLSHEYKLGSTVPVLKLLVQQSNCFVVVDRGAGLEMGLNERALNESGEMRSTSKMHKGQIVAADYAMNPSITFSSNDTGGVGAAVSKFGGGWLGALAGGLKFKEASTLLTLSDNRSSVQLAAAEGSAKNTDFNLFGGLFTGSGAGGAGGYTKTPEGKVIVGAFTDSYNNLVKAVKNYKTQKVKGGLGAGGNLQIQED